MRRRQLPMMKEKSMRKKGENSVNRAGKSAIPPDEDNDFTLGVESQTFQPVAFAAHRDCSAVEAAPAAQGFLPPGHWARCVCHGLRGLPFGYEQNTSRMPRLRPF